MLYLLREKVEKVVPKPLTSEISKRRSESTSRRQVVGGGLTVLNKYFLGRKMKKVAYKALVVISVKKEIKVQVGIKLREVAKPF